MSAPDFNQKTVDLIAYRSAYICANPDCNRLTVAPSLTDAASKVKIGEAAHIHDARERTIRFKKDMPLEDRAKPENGVWLCAREGANKRGNSSRLTQSFHFFMFEPFFLP